MHITIQVINQVIFLVVFVLFRKYTDTFMGLAISISAEPIIHIGDIIITNSLLSTFLVTGFFIALILIFRSKKIVQLPKGKSFQNILELALESLLGFYASIVGKKHAKDYFPFLTTLFFFILFSNWSGLIPGVGSIGLWEVEEGNKILVPFFRAPTADLNTTLALALMGVVFIQYQGLKSLRLDYLKKFFNFSHPISTFVGFLELISEGTKMISFAFRLFGNIFAGEVLLAVMSFLLPFLAPLPFLGLEIFVGIIQSLVFVMLVLVFTQGATAKHH